MLKSALPRWRMRVGVQMRAGRSRVEAIGGVGAVTRTMKEGSRRTAARDTLGSGCQGQGQHFKIITDSSFQSHLLGTP